MPKKRVTLKEVDKKLDKVIRTQKRMLEGQEDILEDTESVEKDEQLELQALAEIREFEKKLKKEVGPHPLRNITYKDIVKGAVGAFFGVGAHFTFVYGIKVAHNIDMGRAVFTMFLAYIFGGIFMYLTGFRKIKVKRVMWFLPYRLTILYITGVITAFFILLLFEPAFLHSFEDGFKMLATTTLSATIGACTADLIGRE